MVKTGLFFGSFNPVHIGHMMIANFFYSYTNLDEVWMVVTPQSPWKQEMNLIAEEHRLEMVKTAIGNTSWIKATLFEKELEQPNYTYKSLQYLREHHPENEFVLLVGGDNFDHFMQWRMVDEILKHHQVWAFPRNHKGEQASPHEKVTMFVAPQMEISSSTIRTAIHEGKDMNYFLPAGVNDYIVKHKLL